MDDALIRLFDEFDRGTISRRQLVQALGLAAIGAALPVRAFGQGRCGGRQGTAGCDTVPAKLPFEPTGWKTVSMDHFTMQAVDPKREAAYYAMLMGWKVRSDDGTRIVMDIGDDVGTVIIRGGYEPPPPMPAPPAGDSTSGGGRGGRGGARPPRHVVWDSFAWGIEPWDAKKVEAALRKRGLHPVEESDGEGYHAFAVTDPGGFTLKVSNGHRHSRRKGPATGRLPAPAPFEPTGWKTVWLDHISFQCPNYKESAAFYQALLGWRPTGDEGSQNECEIGDSGNIIIRGGRGPAAAPGDSTGRGGGGMAPRRIAMIDHISFGITPWDADAVKAELDKRGLSARPDTGSRLDIHDPSAHYKSYHTPTPDGFDLQISNATRETRLVR